MNSNIVGAICLILCNGANSTIVSLVRSTALCALPLFSISIFHRLISGRLIGVLNVAIYLICFSSFVFVVDNDTIEIGQLK